jgi:hypothetical protein
MIRFRSLPYLGGKLADLALAVLILTEQEVWAAGLLLIVGGIDLVLLGFKQRTVSEVVWGQYDPWTDAALLVTWLIAILAVRGLNPACWYAIGVIYGHWHWQRSDAPPPTSSGEASEAKSGRFATTILLLPLITLLLIACSACAPRSESVPLPPLGAETGRALAPTLVRVDRELADGKVASARAYLAPVLALVGPAEPTRLKPDEVASELAKIEKRSRASEDKARAEQQADQRWERVRSQFWYLLLAGAVATAAGLAFTATRALAVYPAAVAVGSGGVLVFASSVRQIVADLAATAWGLIPVVLIGAALAGTAAFIWSRLRRTTKVLHAVEDGVERLDGAAKAAVTFEAVKAGVHADLHASLRKRGLARKETAPPKPAEPQGHIERHG